MKDAGPLHCPTCGTGFDTQIELDHHERLRHTQKGRDSGGMQSNVKPPPTEERPSSRKDREFTRRNAE